MTVSIAIPVIAFISYCGLLLIVYRSPRTKVSVIFSHYLLFMIVWSVGSFMMRTGYFPGPKIWNMIMIFGTIGEPFVFYRFCCELVAYRKHRWMLALGHVLYTVFSLTNAFSLIVTYAYLDNGSFVYKLGPAAGPFAAVAAVYQLSAAVLLIKSGIKDPATFWSNHLLCPSIGSVLVLIGSLLNFFPVIGQYPVDIAANLINAYLLTYTIYRYRLLDITLSIRRGVVYSILTVTIGGIYALVALAVDRLSGNSNFITILSTIVAAALITLLFEPTKMLLGVWMDKVFQGSQYDYKKTLRTFSQLMTSILDLDELAKSTLELVSQALDVASAALFLADANGNYYLHTAVGLTGPTTARINNTSPIIRWLSKQNEPAILRHELETRPGFQGLWEQEKRDLTLLQMELLVGIKIRRELIGLLILSPKSSGDPFSDDDRELIITLANEAAVAIKNAQTYANVRQAAIRDELTNLYNYRYFQDCLDKEIIRHQPDGRPMTIIMMDLDLFKAYNDVFGHLLGDQALVKVSQAILSSIRATDIAARYGGDEFAVILPHTGLDDGLQIAHDIRRAIKKAFAGAGNRGQMLSCSLGVAEFPTDGKNKQQLMAFADQALFQAKRAGRNQVSGRLMAPGDPGSANDARTTASAEREFLMRQVEDAYLATVYALSAAINARDNYTYVHSEMVTLYAIILADALGLSESRKTIIHHAAMLHDIGKIGVPEYILNKPGPLTPAEREVIESHVPIADAIIGQMPYLRHLAPIIRSHHERYDGKGYPQGLRGEQIPLEARILAIADAYHAMTSDRPYRSALSRSEAKNQLSSLAGQQFDPQLVPLFLRALEHHENQPHEAAAGAEDLLS